MTRRSLRINAGIAAGALATGAAFTLGLHAAGMPPVLTVISAVIVGSAAVLLAGLVAE